MVNDRANTPLKSGSMKSDYMKGCADQNRADKNEFRTKNDRASAGANGHLTGGNAERVEKEIRGIE